jgi:hypothetical protein
MQKKDFIKIINEEISNFDFLGNEKRLEEQEITDLLKNEDFQKQFICDSLLSINDDKKTERNSKIKINIIESRVGGNWEDDFEDATHITLDYYLEIEYKYDRDKEPIKFTLIFDSKNIPITKGGYYDKGTYDIAPSGKAYYTELDWDSIDVALFTIEGDEIEFTAFNRAPHNIQTLFIREYTEDYIVNNTMDIEYNSKRFLNLTKSPYCP